MGSLCFHASGDAGHALVEQLKAALHALDGKVTSADASRRGSTLIVAVDAIDPDVFRTIRNHGNGRVLVVAPDSVAAQHAWDLLEYGASDVIPFRNDAQAAADIMERIVRWDAIDAMVASDVVQANLVGPSAVWTAALRQIVEIARYTDAPCLIGGETGTGKELAARLIHTLDPRPRKGNLVLVDCTTLAPELTGSELFGHERGAFTGAISPRDGACALADGGTLFLDEIGELPLTLQSELLRVVQEGTFKRVGSDNWRKATFRLVCATNRQLPDEVAAGRFRSDLYYRIAGISCRLPSLRERRDDIMPLVEHFIAALAPKQARGLQVNEAVAVYLTSRDYPGNVRELRQLVARMLARHAGNGTITVGDIPADERPRAAVVPIDWRDDGFTEGIRRALAMGVKLKDIGRAAEDVAINMAMRESKSVRGAAHRLGVTDRALQLRRNGRPARQRDPSAG
jgi:transcriptional regulator with GAF, ATPase, and Fis domain